MKILKAKLFFSFAVSVFLLNGCAENKNVNVNSSAPNTNQTSNSKTEITAKDDIEELGKTVKLPYTPEEATYSEVNLNDKNSAPPFDKSPAPNEKKLVAVLKFSSEDANQIIARAEKYKSPAPADIDAESWFPPELVAKSQETGDESLKGVEYAANDFFQTPFINGRLTRLNDTDYFVLELTSF
ncbi:MAG: hypothetical protein ACR2HG_00615 [Pyrinomonadaceae bacterium]